MSRPSALRQVLAAVLLAVLTLSGVGRAMALAAAAPHGLSSIAGVTVEICHPGTGDPTGPAAPGDHDCCEACALCAAFAPPDGPPFVMPVRVERVVGHADALPRAPSVARVPTPRLSQGPPAA